MGGKGDSEARPSSPWAFAIPGIVAAIGVLGLVRNLDHAGDLKDAPLTPVVDTAYRKNKPPAPIIEVDGQRYTCSGGTRHGSTVQLLDGEVRYDPKDPGDCRYAESVGVMTRQERFGLGLSIATLLFAVFLVFRILRDD